MRRWYTVLPLATPLLLAGCAVVPGSPSSSAPATPPPALVATQVAAAVQATMAALSGTVDPPPGGSTATPFRGGAGPTPQVVTSALTASPAGPTSTQVSPLSATPRPSGTTHPSDTPIPSATHTYTPTPVPTPVILGPAQLAEREIGGGKLLPRYWTNTPAIVFTMSAASGSAPATRPEVEVLPVARAFTGTPTAEGAPMQPGQPGSVTLSVATLPQGAYHWQARLSDGNGHNGPWVDYYNGPAFRLDREPPDAPV
ncbi:MAG TPA: hypothetical protein VN837_14820, partial [Chloroflexota bacterium]|nr:hypothetical protein [Chloroflexota bacterium]